MLRQENLVASHTVIIISTKIIKLEWLWCDTEDDLQIFPCGYGGPFHVFFVRRFERRKRAFVDRLLAEILSGVVAFREGYR
jgi:hypothetical protein